MAQTATLSGRTVVRLGVARRHHPGNPAVARNQDGLFELFVRGSDFAIWRNAPTADSWAGWTSLHGVLLGDPIVSATNHDGRLEVFAQGGDHMLWQECNRRPIALRGRIGPRSEAESSSAILRL